MTEIFGSSLMMAGLIDLDGSFLVQLTVFGIFALALNFLVLKPMIAAHDARYAKMEGARVDADAMDLRAARARSEYDENITRIRQDAVSIRDGAKNEAQDRQREALATAQSSASSDEAASNEALKKELDDARVKASAEAETLADAIVSRLLGEGGRS